MEKFRKFGDAATGVNPFTFVIAPTTGGRIAAAVMYPMRLLFSSCFLLLLLVVDALSYLLYVVWLGFLGRWLVGPVQRLLLRALLFFHAHLIPVRSPSEAAGAVLLSGQGRSSAETHAQTALRLRRPKSGDVVVCNMQSVWDVAVLEVALSQPYHAVVFPLYLSSSADDKAEPGIVRRVVGGQTRVGGSTIDDPIADEDGEMRVKVFWPGPLQRWHVWRYVRRTGQLDFLKAQVACAAASAATPVVNMIEAQRQARQRGVPVLCFTEGTCSNGKGLLKMPAMRLSIALEAEASDKECVVWTAMTTYDTPALQNVVSEGEGVFRFLFRASVLLYGSTNPQWTSPFFPRAEVLARAVAVPTSSGARCLRRVPDGSTTKVVGPWPWELSASGIEHLRTGMCQRPRSAVVLASTGGAGSAVSSRRHPLSVGMAEKLGFVETYIAM